jgi:hypothetical protein
MYSQKKRKKKAADTLEEEAIGSNTRERLEEL